MPDYKLKLKALLHDPLDKQYVMWELKKNHEEVAKEYFKKLIDESIEDKNEDKNIETADHLASAISRIIVSPQNENFKKNQNLKQKREIIPNPDKIIFIDPFSLKTYFFKTDGKPSNENEVKQFLEDLGQCSFTNQEERAKLFFLFLWRFLPEIFPWINIHPADSRAPNHSIYDHLVQTSAIVSSLPKPAFLLFTIGPVQEYIFTARKTSDLWAGSYILSYLIYKAIEVILEELGPDNIIYPNLLGNPLVDKWLYETFKNTQIAQKFENEIWFKNFIDNTRSDETLTIANFPNRFLAIVPFDKAKEIAEECKNKILKEFNNWVENLDKLDELKNKLDESKKISLTSETKNQIKLHLENYFQIYYVYLPWFNFHHTDVETVLNEYKDLVGENEVYRAVKIIAEHPYYKPSNVGTAYSLLCELTDRFLASRKMFRKFEDIGEQKGEKCHLCGNYDVLDFDWEKLKKGIVREKERLCGVCFIKRIFPSLINEFLKISKLKFPSTSEMVTVLWKRELKDDEIKNFIKKFGAFKEKIGRDTIPESVSVPALRNHLFYKIDEHPLYEIDGQWFFESSYRKKYLKREYGISEEEFNCAKSEIDEILETIRSFEKKAPTYYAILMMDGDEMGKWLKGKKMPKIEELIHEKAKDVLLKYSENKDEEQLRKLLCLRHPISASIHQGFSRRLSEFALKKVRDIVENKNYGKLIYAGGDDLLAFLPLEKAFDCAYSLQKNFKEVLGEKASISAGIVIAHHKYPLGLALNKVRQAEEKAKNDYGRNAFYITYLSKGGEERGFGGKWEIKEFLNDIKCLFLNKKISRGFGYELSEAVEKLEKLELIEPELKRIIKRKFNNKGMSKEEIDSYQEKILDMLKRYNPYLKDFANIFIIMEKIWKKT
ncbi:MAG: type III-B CRISPR-associated protein Cas10/Cmr2 [bacterium]